LSTPLSQRETRRHNTRQRLIRVLPRALLGALSILVAAITFLEAYLAFRVYGGSDNGARAISIVLNILQCATIAGGVAWFFATTQFQPRAAFDVESAFFRLNNDRLVAEVRFIFENKGFIDIFISDLAYTVHTLDDGGLHAKVGNDALVFPRRLVPSDPAKRRASVIPEAFRYVYVRPGVRQMLTHIVSLPPETEIVRVTAGFSYSFLPGDYHTTRRVFSVPLPRHLSA